LVFAFPRSPIVGDALGLEVVAPTLLDEFWLPVPMFVLGLTLVLGLTFGLMVTEPPPGVVPVTLGVWLVYLVVLLLRWRARIVSVRFAWVCLVMFGIALLSLGPVNSSRHQEIILTPER